MTSTSDILITGAAGNLGFKLRQHWQGRRTLRLLDIEPCGDASIVRADLSRWEPVWTELFHGVETVVHLAGDPVAFHTWEQLAASNFDATLHVFQAAAEAGVRRVVFASSNHVMGGYQDDAAAGPIAIHLPPRPGTRYIADGLPRDSTAYGAIKLLGERIGERFAARFGLSVIAVRLGWVWRGDNRPHDLPAERGAWFRLMWLSNRDFCHLLDRCVDAKLDRPFAIVNGMSANSGMRWDLSETRRLLDYSPQDDVTHG